VNIADAYTASGFDFSGTRKFDEVTGYRSGSFLTVPMKNHENEIIGVLQLINAIDPDDGSARVFSSADQRLAESLASQAAVALTNRLLVNQLEQLFESFIKLINLAIDEKSPYTGGHCQRVPALTMMLAEAVEITSDGPLAGFAMSDKDRYELKIAGLLHDCGKVTTPVHVVDKATKLQTIFDRIGSSIPASRSSAGMPKSPCCAPSWPEPSAKSGRVALAGAVRGHRQRPRLPASRQHRRRSDER
jgi:hypothetical protein